MVCRAGGYYGQAFSATRGTTQGGPFSPRLFNILVDAIAREWLRQVIGKDSARLGYGEAVRMFLALFYADDGAISLRSSEQMHASTDILFDLFE